MKQNERDRERILTIYMQRGDAYVSVFGMYKCISGSLSFVSIKMKRKRT